MHSFRTLPGISLLSGALALGLPAAGAGRATAREFAAPPPLSPTERADLLAALDEEYRAFATYVQVIADFGDVRPFANIVESERRHADAVAGLLQHHGVSVPSNTWPGRVPRYGSVREACEAAVVAEIENGALYERLLAGTARPDILSVYRNLQEASQQRHLPAFRRCVEREAKRPGGGPPHGARRRRGPG